jgi:hypothetical protein
MDSTDENATGNGAGEFASRERLTAQSAQGERATTGVLTESAPAGSSGVTDSAPSSGQPSAAANASEAGATADAGAPSEVGDRLRAAAQTAEYLVELLRDVEHEVTAAADTRESEDAGQELTDLRDNVRTAALDGLTPEGLQAMGELVEALVKKPSDLLVMVKLSEQADKLSAIIRSHQSVLALVQDPEPPAPLPQGERGE